MLLMRDEYPPVGDEVQVDVDPPAALPAPQPEGPRVDVPGTGPALEQPAPAPDPARPQPGSGQAGPPQAGPPGAG
jgi:hypothetical protein